MPKLSPSARDQYVERIRKAMETTADEMPRADYIDALEEVQGDIEGMLEAAREEQENEEDDDE